MRGTKTFPTGRKNMSRYAYCHALKRYSTCDILRTLLRMRCVRCSQNMIGKTCPNRDSNVQFARFATWKLTNLMRHHKYVIGWNWFDGHKLITRNSESTSSTFVNKFCRASNGLRRMPPIQMRLHFAKRKTRRTQTTKSNGYHDCTCRSGQQHREPSYDIHFCDLLLFLNTKTTQKCTDQQNAHPICAKLKWRDILLILLLIPYDNFR